MVVVVVVVVVVLALALVGILPFFQGAGGGGASTFSSSRSAAQAAANGYPGGAWNLFGADGIASTTSLSSPTSNLTSNLAGTGCTFTSASTAPSTLTLGTVTDVSAGSSASWVFLFKNNAGTSILVVSVLDGSTNVLGTLTGASCLGGFLNVLGTLGANIIDSTQAASTANSGGGSTFVSAHPGAWGSFTVSAGYSYLGFSSGPTWTVTYSACPLSLNATGTAAQFTATVNATSGALIHAGTTTATCSGFGGAGGGGGATPIGSVLAFGAPAVQNFSGYAWNYSVGVTSASAGLTIADITFAVTTAGGTPVTLPSATLVAYSGGSVVASFSLTSKAWSFGGSTTMTTSITFALYTYQSLGGDILVVSGAGAYSGSIPVPLPAG